MLYKSEEAGVVVDYTHEADAFTAVNYACVTAPQLAYVEVAVNDRILDGVWVGPGSSHSWWTMAGGKLLRFDMRNGDRLIVTASGPVALRIDWDEETA